MKGRGSHLGTRDKVSFHRASYTPLGVWCRQRKKLRCVHKYMHALIPISTMHTYKHTRVLYADVHLAQSQPVLKLLSYHDCGIVCQICQYLFFLDCIEFLVSVAIFGKVKLQLIVWVNDRAVWTITVVCMSVYSSGSHPFFSNVPRVDIFSSASKRHFWLNERCNSHRCGIHSLI